MTAGRITLGSACFILLLSAVSTACLAEPNTRTSPQPAPPVKKTQPQQPTPQPQAQAQRPSGPSIPNNTALNLIIRTTLIGLNQANQTGNYSVLIDLGAPGFRAGNSNASLAQVFAQLRQRRIDLSPILFFNPKLVAKPAINERGLLRLTGFIATAPEQVNFDLTFQPVNGVWRIYGIGVSTSPAKVAAAPQQPGPQQQAPSMAASMPAEATGATSQAPAAKQAAAKPAARTASQDRPGANAVQVAVPARAVSTSAQEKTGSTVTTATAAKSAAAVQTEDDGVPPRLPLPTPREDKRPEDPGFWGSLFGSGGGE